jgi:hypothetical protein
MRRDRTRQYVITESDDILIALERVFEPVEFGHEHLIMPMRRLSEEAAI